MKTEVVSKTSLARQLSSRRIRMTAQRRALLETIEQANGHLDAASLLRLARKRDNRLDRATVYRTLDLLKRLHLIDELDLMHLKGGGHFYEAKHGIEHVHLACFDCGRIQEFTSPLFTRLKAEIAREKGFEITEARVEIGGRCSECCAGSGGDTVLAPKRATVR